MKPIRCVIKEGKEKPLEGRHPWVYSGSIESIDDGYKVGDIVKVYSGSDRFLGMGYLNPRSQIAIRMLTFEDVSINEKFFEKKIKKAVEFRRAHLPPQTDSYRLIHSEGDFLPGLIADVYGDYLVVQFLTAGMDVWRDTIAGILNQEMNVKGIFQKDDSEWRDAEGLEKRVQKLTGEDPPDYVEIMENGRKFVVDFHGGQKTGFYLDQRENRLLVQGLAKQRRVLNCFCYTGAFTVYAAAGGAVESVSVDSSEEALNTAKVNAEKNGLSPSAHQWVCEDTATYLRATRQEFDFIILDPPAFCKNKHQILQASRGYKDINLQAIRRLAPGGMLLTSSCSSFMDMPLFQKILFGAAKDAKRNLKILKKTFHSFDHPVSIYHPEGEYLKSLLLVLD